MNKSRHFELTIGVFGPLVDDGTWEIPETFEDWLRLAFGDRAVDEIGASSTTLLRVVETKRPLSEDIIKAREKLGVTVQYS